MIRATLRRSFIRFNSTKTATTGLTKQQLKSNPAAQQAPNRAATWSPSQANKQDVIATHAARFIQRDLDKQPNPYAAIDLIAQVPIKYIHDNIAVCDGNKGNTLQGHPKVFINLDQPKANTCGYCGLRYAQEHFKPLIEAQEKAVAKEIKEEIREEVLLN